MADENKVIDVTPETEEATKKEANKIVDKIKELVKSGNVTYIRIKKGDSVILNLPMNVGIVGTALGMAFAPWAIIIATLTTLGLSCTVEVEKKDGEVVIIHEGKK